MVVSKLRAWWKSKKKMIPVMVIDWVNQIVDGRSPDIEIDFDDVALMHSAGLFDKNGTKIFESDIVEFEDSADLEDTFTNRGVVEKWQLGFTITNRQSVEMEDLLDGNILKVEIIGNIYENPELLEEVGK